MPTGSLRESLSNGVCGPHESGQTLSAFPAGGVVGSADDDVILMASALSQSFLSCGTYQPDFFDRVQAGIPDNVSIEQGFFLKILS